MKSTYITLIFSLVLSFSIVAEAAHSPATVEVENPTTLTGVNACIGQQGKVQWLTWENGRYREMEDLYSDVYYPTTPTHSQYITQLQSPQNYNTYFGAVIRGFIKPSQSGNHQFNLTGDNKGVFLLSTTDNPTNLVERCSFSAATAIDGHAEQGTQTSVNINLNANQYYYFEVRYTEEWGVDHATVYWKTPSNSAWTIIPNINLYEYTCATVCTLPGTPCDDGNSATTGDVYDGFCNCVGTPPTTNNCVGERNKLRTLIWKGLDGYGLDLLYNAPDYPHKPDTLENITRFANPLDNSGDDFGSKTAAFLVAPATGSYTFNVTSDDYSDLFLSTNHDPANKTKIASVGGWTRSTEHDKYPTQTSAPINLVKGQYYYVEINQHDGSGGDHFQVHWKSAATNPNHWQIIEGLYLFDYTCDVTCIPEGTPCDDGNANTKDDAYDANCNCTGIPCSGSDCDPPPSYEAYGACDATDKHSQNPKDSWSSCQKSTSPNPSRGNTHWIQYDFGQSYPITGAHIWNYNVTGQTNQGFKNVAIDYSDDGTNWTQLGTYTWAQASGNTNYAGFNGPDFGEISARYVLVTALDSWSSSNCAGFSQISFNIGECPDVGKLCDDKNPNTIQDNINTNCECEGVGAAVNDCETDRMTVGNEVVRADNYGVRHTIESEGIITNGTKVNYVAGESITLKPGFTAQGGSDFLAVILACSSSIDEEQPVASRIAKITDKPLAGAAAESTTTVDKTKIVEKEIPIKADLTVMPNPTRSWTTFSFDIPYRTKASLCVFTTNGQKVTCLSDNFIFSAGQHTKEFPAQQLAKGIYFVMLKTEQEVITKNFVVVD